MGECKAIATIYVMEKFENNSWPVVDFDCPVVGRAEFGGVVPRGNWSNSASKHHINYLEMLAIFLGLYTYARTNARHMLE